MSDKGIQFIVSEYNVLWEALNHYEERLEKLSSMTLDEDQKLNYDEKLQDIEGIKSSLRIAALDNYDLELK